MVAHGSMWCSTHTINMPTLNRAPLHRRPSRGRGLQALWLSACLLAACSSSAEEDQPMGGAADAEPSTVSPEIQSALEEVVSWLGGELPDEAEYESRFSPEFKSALAYDDFVATFDSLRLAGPWTLGAIQQLGAELAIANVMGKDNLFEIQLRITAGAKPLIAELLVMLKPVDPAPIGEIP